MEFELAVRFHGDGVGTGIGDRSHPITLRDVVPTRDPTDEHLVHSLFGGDLEGAGLGRGVVAVLDVPGVRAVVNVADIEAMPRRLTTRDFDLEGEADRPLHLAGAVVRPSFERRDAGRLALERGALAVAPSERDVDAVQGRRDRHHAHLGSVGGRVVVVRSGRVVVVVEEVATSVASDDQGKEQGAREREQKPEERGHETLHCWRRKRRIAFFRAREQFTESSVGGAKHDFFNHDPADRLKTRRFTINMS